MAKKAAKKVQHKPATVPADMPQDAVTTTPSLEPPDEQPVPDNASTDTARAVMGALTGMRKEKTEKVKREEEGRLYYLACPKCSQPGCFFTERPHGKHIRNEMWFATYRGPRDQWSSSRIFCQNCYDTRGRHTPLRIAFSNENGRPGFRLKGKYAERIGSMKGAASPAPAATNSEPEPATNPEPDQTKEAAGS